jgi:hypothetical protein
MTYDTFLRKLSIAALALCVAFIALFAGDFLVLRIRIAAHGVDAVTTQLATYTAAPLKDGKYSVFYDQPQMQTCVRSIFPWLGDEPCWYLQRHDVNIVN